MFVATFFTLPTDWLDTVKGHSGQLFTDFFPIVALIVGIFLAVLAIRYLVGLVK